jgi:hypothetical protein
MTHKPRWYNVFGEAVDLDDIDKRYAANILGHIDNRPRGRYGLGDALIDKLEEVAANGRRPNLRDRLRAVRYNIRCWREGQPYRAPVL